MPYIKLHEDQVRGVGRLLVPARIGRVHIYTLQLLTLLKNEVLSRQGKNEVFKVLKENDKEKTARCSI